VRIIAACVLYGCLSAGGVSVAQSPSNKAEQVGAMIDILSAVKRAVTQRYKGQEATAYKRVSIRSFQCALLFGVLTSVEEGKTDASRNSKLIVTYKFLSQVLNLVSGTINPNSIEDYKRDVVKAKSEVEEM
jgi:hypothetical protein